MHIAKVLDTGPPSLFSVATFDRSNHPPTLHDLGLFFLAGSTHLPLPRQYRYLLSARG
jgi:hypothetical protein